eukprot:1011159-Prorocentrum_lima.AAC.1
MPPCTHPTSTLQPLIPPSTSSSSTSMPRTSLGERRLHRDLRRFRDRGLSQHTLGASAQLSQH